MAVDVLYGNYGSLFESEVFKVILTSDRSLNESVCKAFVLPVIGSCTRGRFCWNAGVLEAASSQSHSLCRYQDGGVSEVRFV